MDKSLLFFNPINCDRLGFCWMCMKNNPILVLSTQSIDSTDSIQRSHILLTKQTTRLDEIVAYCFHFSFFYCRQFSIAVSLCRCCRFFFSSYLHVSVCALSHFLDMCGHCLRRPACQRRRREWQTYTHTHTQNGNDVNIKHRHCLSTRQQPDREHLAT